MQSKRLEEYEKFIKSKINLDQDHGVQIEGGAINPILKPHQQEIVRWLVAGGRRACFAAFGLGKSVIQLETLRLILAQIEDGKALIVAPLGVRQEFKRDAGMLDIPVRFIRRTEEIDEPGIYLTNYESVRDGKLNPRVFDAASLDEASVLRGFGGTKTFREFMTLFAGDEKKMDYRNRTASIPYRFVATATPSPNDYIELLAYAAFLGVMDVSAGKAQPLDAKILTPDGWKLMGEISTGDKVIARDGKPCSVLGVFPQGEKEIFKITFDDGSFTECTGDHLWLTKTQLERTNESRYLRGIGRKTNRKIRENSDFATVKTTDDIAKSIKYRKSLNHSIPMVSPVEFDSRDISIDPYLLGVLLGDGYLRKVNVLVSSADEWILDRVKIAIPDGLDLKKISPDKYDYHIRNPEGRGKRNKLVAALRSYNLAGKLAHEKSIPKEYLFNSVFVRLSILRGLMDTDGTVDKRGSCSFSSCSEQLAKDVQFLVQSLGGSSTIRIHKTSGRDAYRVSVGLPTNINPFSLPRKADRVKPRYRHGSSRSVASVESMGVKQAQCIMIDHPDHLYVTDDFIVTHNTRFFKRDSQKADKLTLHPHKEKEFWLWVASWAIFVQKPSDLGFDDTGYTLPAMTVRWHEIPSDHSKAGSERDGQMRMFSNAALGVQSASAEKRNSLPQRIDKMLEIVNESPDDHFLLWHDLEAERHAIKKALPTAQDVYGSQDMEIREQRIIDFSDGKIQYLATKPRISGSGCNFQRYCHRAIFLGIGFKFNDFIQSIHRVQRFLQDHPVEVDLIYTEAEREIKKVLETKWSKHNEMVGKMTKIIKDFGLNHATMLETLSRTIGVERVEVTGENHKIINNDSVIETESMEDNSVDLILTSVPFSTQYEYSPSYLDFGHTDNNDHFMRQMDFLTPNLLRVLKPGRIAAIHVKDRIVPGGLTGLGYQTVYPFHAECIAHYTRHGFGYIGMKTIVTDVVRENNQTYRLGWTEQCKDGTKMGVGMPEYLLLFRKHPTDTANSYADLPVVKDKKRYTRAKWQIDAHGFSRSSGNRLLTPEELEGLPHHVIFKLFRQFSLERVYDFEHHVKLGEALDERGILPVTFMLLQPQSWHPDVWTDITRMLTLNTAQSAKGKEMHLCLARGSRVLTKEHGYIPIEQVGLGMNVLTHRGRWRKVLAAMKTGVQPVVTVKAQGVPGLTLTPDHKVWARKTDKARNREYAEHTDPTWVEAENTIGAYLNMKIPNTDPSLDDECLWWTVGRWLADGHIDARNCAIISVGKHKFDLFSEKINRFGGDICNVAESSVQVRLKDPKKELRNILKDCGKGAANKKIPPRAFTLQKSLASALLAGYLSGDGHYIEDRQRWQATSISRDLLLGLSMIVQKVYGTIASIYAGRPDREHVIEGRTVQAKQEWMISFDINNPEGRKTPFILDDGAWKKVSSIKDAGEAETWCLKVEEDESFTAEGCIVKNCPMQFDLADRVIEQFTNPGETVFDPFAGLGTVPYRAIKAGRKGIGIELSPRYFFDACGYCKAMEDEVAMPDMFAAIDEEDQEMA